MTKELVKDAVNASGNNGDNVSVIALKLNSGNKIQHKLYLLIFAIILISIFGWKIWSNIING
jgi:hypothetical protein